METLKQTLKQFWEIKKYTLKYIFYQMGKSK